MKRVFQYRLIKWTWGIAIDITAEAMHLSRGLNPEQEVIDGLWLEILDPYINAEEQRFIEEGIRIVSKEIFSKPVSLPVLIRVHNVWYNPTDYQPEGLVCAMAGWLSGEFELPSLDIRVDFDRNLNRYIFHFNSV